MIDQQTVRVAALNNRIPTAVLVLEVFGAAFAFGLLALYTALHGRGATTVVLAGALVTVLLVVIFDLDRPTRGLIRVPDAPLDRAARLDGTTAGGARADTVNLDWAALIVAGVATVAITAMLLVRRRAPEGSYFEDGDRAAGRVRRPRDRVRGAARASSSSSPSRASTPRAAAPRPRRRSSCSSSRPPSSCRPPSRGRASRASSSATRARSCSEEWPRMESGTLTDELQPLGSRHVRHAQDGGAAARRPSRPRTASGSTSAPTAESARADRTHGAEGVIPTPLWIVLLLTAGDDLRLHALLRRQRASERSCRRP